MLCVAGRRGNEMGKINSYIGTVVVGQSRPSSEVGEMSVVSILEFDLSGRGDIGKDSRARAHVESRAYDGVYHSPSELT